ncbi:hypothetical protein Ptr902_08687 [Pyrenophora tritici-repentis]|nr:hypothetical protein Ptr902_08687 [Pyrenophora tritici-repentis]
MTTSSDPMAQQSRARQPSAKSPAQLQVDFDGILPSPKRSESKGKLPGVSQAVKRSLLSRLSAQSNDFDNTKECRAEEFATTPAASSAASRKQRVSERVQSTSSQKPVNPVRGRKRNDNGESVISQPKQKKMMNAKRKAVTDVTEGHKQVKRPCVPSTNSIKSDVIGTNGEERVRLIAQSPPFIASPQHPLIRGLSGSHMPTDNSNTPFKKPILPARSTQTLKTPTKPRIQPAGKKRLYTPKDARRRSWDEVYHLSSSPSVFYDADATGDWLQTGFDQEILSSNSKPVPASPNAESTAISGHADRDDVVSEKRTGDTQTEKSNPFIQRRAERKATTFLRRLTGEDQANEQVDGSLGSPHGVRITLNGSTGLEAKALSEKSRAVASHMPSQKRKPNDPRDRSDASKPCQIEGIKTSTLLPDGQLSKREHGLNESPKHEQCAITQLKQLCPRKTTSPSRQGCNNRKVHHRTKRQSHTSLVAKDIAKPTPENLQVPTSTKIHDFRLSDSHNIFDNTPIKRTAEFFGGYVQDKPYIDCHNDDDDAVLPMIYTSSPPTFHSSPPLQTSLR